jgi:hypothetical protein
MQEVNIPTAGDPAGERLKISRFVVVGPFVDDGCLDLGFGALPSMLDRRRAFGDLPC